MVIQLAVCGEVSKNRHDYDVPPNGQFLDWKHILLIELLTLVQADKVQSGMNGRLLHFGM